MQCEVNITAEGGPRVVLPTHHPLLCRSGQISPRVCKGYTGDLCLVYAPTNPEELSILTQEPNKTELQKFTMTMS